MSAPSQARKMLDHLRQMPNATPAKALAEFRRRLVEAGVGLKAKRR